MKAARTVLLVTTVALLLAMILGPAALAVPPGTITAVSGDWAWVNNSATETTLADGSILITGDEYGTWTGSFRGRSYDVFEMTLTPPFDWDNGIYGPAWGTLTATFTGKVGVNRGTMTMFFTIREPANDPVMVGEWRILSGTKALKHIRGNGTWVSSGYDSSATYAGTITWK